MPIPSGSRSSSTIALDKPGSHSHSSPAVLPTVELLRRATSDNAVEYTLPTLYHSSEDHADELAARGFPPLAEKATKALIDLGSSSKDAIRSEGIDSGYLKSAKASQRVKDFTTASTSRSTDVQALAYELVPLLQYGFKRKDRFGLDSKEVAKLDSGARRQRKYRAKIKALDEK